MRLLYLFPFLYFIPLLLVGCGSNETTYSEELAKKHADKAALKVQNDADRMLSERLDREFPTAAEARPLSIGRVKGTEQLKTERIKDAEYWIKWHIKQGERRALLYKTVEEVDNHVAHYLRYKGYKVIIESPPGSFLEVTW